MFIAYGAFAVVVAGYVISLVTRVRAMARRGDMIEPARRP
jgi:hypothetical protein